MRELADLAPRARLLVDAAAVLGIEFDIGLAADLAELDGESSALAALDEFLQHEMIATG